MKGQVRLLELQQRHNWNRDTLLLAVVLLDDPYPFTLHFSAFIAVIEAQGTEEQIKEWIPPSERMEILGSQQSSRTNSRLLCSNRVYPLMARLT